MGSVYLSHVVLLLYIIFALACMPAAVSSLAIIANSISEYLLERKTDLLKEIELNKILLF